MALMTARAETRGAIRRRSPWRWATSVSATVRSVSRAAKALILAGLLDNQADRVAAAYRAQGLRLVDRIDSPGESGHWPTLRFRKRPSAGWKRPRRWRAGANGEAPGFGSW